MRFNLLLIFFFSVCFSFGNNIKLISVSKNQEPINLNDFTYLYTTKDTSVNINKVLSKEFNYSVGGLGINNNTIYWERFSFQNNTNDTLDYIIYFTYSVINKIVAYQKHDDVIKHIASLGMQYRKRDKVIESIGYPIPIKLQPKQTDIYIYIKTFNLALRTTSFLLSDHQLIKSNREEEKLIWLWKGFFLFATIIAFILFLVSKLRMFLYYFLLNIGVGLFFTAEMGEITSLIDLVPYNLTANFKQTGVLIAFIFFPLLVNELSPISKVKPKIWKFLYYTTAFISIFWAGCFITPFMNSKFLLYTTYLYNGYAPILLLVMLYLLMLAYKHNLKNARILFFGYSIYSLVLFLYIIFPNLGILKHSLHVYSTFIYGSLIEIFMFMLLIGKETLSMYEQRSQLLKKQKKHQTDIIRAIVESQESERNKVGRELHDMIGANISVIKQQIDKDNRPLIGIIDRTIESVRSLSHGLITPLIKDDDFVDEIHELCALFSKVDLEVRSQFHNWSHNIKSSKATHLYRIVQELLQNAIKHSKAKNVLIQFITDNEGSLTLMYEDDGMGFDYKDAYNNHGLGLINIYNRIKLIGAKITYDTEKNRKGTTIIIVLDDLM